MRLLEALEKSVYVKREGEIEWRDMEKEGGNILTIGDLNATNWIARYKMIDETYTLRVEIFDGYMSLVNPAYKSTNVPIASSISKQFEGKTFEIHFKEIEVK